jgi:hypothetical protein
MQPQFSEMQSYRLFEINLQEVDRLGNQRSANAVADTGAIEIP